jgi:diacylglycerol kinase (ATP)
VAGLSQPKGLIALHSLPGEQLSHDRYGVAVVQGSARSSTQTGVDDVALLINPAAGRGKGSSAGELAARELRKRGVAVHELIGADALETEMLARRAVAEGRGALVACGGDGVVHLALNAAAGTDVPLGIVPAGSGNDFARVLGIPIGDVRRAVSVIAEGRVRDVDLALAGDRWFGAVLAAGFDSRVNDRMNRMRWPRGRIRYHLAIVAELARFRPLPFVLEVDGATQELDAMLVAVGNGPSYGGGMRICPAAAVDDGLLDVTVVTRISRAKLLRLFPSVYPGTHVRRPEVLTFRCRSITLSSPGIAAYADGEFVTPLPVTCSAVPGAVRVLVP